MYKMFYETLIPNFGDRILNHAVDTDSMFLSIKSPNVYKEIKDLGLDKLINSSKELFTYQDENANDVMINFNIIRAKQYSYETIPKETFVGQSPSKNKGVKKLKGIQKSIVANRITNKNYQDCLNDVNPKQFEIVNSLRSYKHNINLVEQKKQSFFNFDDKRAILSDGITTIPHNYEKTKMNMIKNLDEINKKYGTNVTDMEIYNVKIRYKI